MSVRAKFRCFGITHQPSNDPSVVYAKVELMPVYEQEGANKQWSKATPSGKIEMFITNPAAVEWFEQGKQYYVDFTPAE
ncbi:hypothetical protein PPF1_21 [Rhizobium phage vB_RleM_PPF1]|uniref:hypothetical protein n=1 Tax=Rhizobium phage vB_RleM_PPF1 TaxID=1498228 RepID=UPI00049AFDDD|nr:hypothetical protein PPF1_21 [Rhizobium phage vB_RleM_PPF1]AID18334.1 hypothetical protein PPF1_21 [Rhizobium phage vB_RleM_PPF1]